MSLVSICIPSCNRPELLREAVESAMAQTHRAIDVIVSDDSADNRGEVALADLIASGTIRYARNDPPRGQADNVNHLFDMARGEFLVLLHDDDLLERDAVAQLLSCMNRVPGLTAAFGRQYVVHADGAPDEAASRQLNARYRRTSEFAGLQSAPLLSGLTGQFPNDGYLVRTAVARAVRYRDTPEVGDVCDFDFGVRLAAVGSTFYFLDRYTARYRLTESSLTARGNYAHLSLELIRSAPLPPELEAARLCEMRRYAGAAVNRWLAVGGRGAALRIYASNAYGWRRRLTRMGLRHACLLARPSALRWWLTTSFGPLQRRNHAD